MDDGPHRAAPVVREVDPASREQVAALVRLHREASRRAWPGVPWGVPYGLRRRRGGMRAAIVESRGKPAGFAVYRAPAVPVGAVEVLALAVSGVEDVEPGASLARSLADHVTDFAWRAGLPAVTATLGERDVAARGTWERLGAHLEGDAAGALRASLPVSDSVTRMPIPESWRPRSDGGDDGAAGGWRGYWERLRPLPRSLRAEALHYVERLAAAVELHAGMRVLDFGCGFGFTAEALARKVASVAVWDGARNMRLHARLTLAGDRNVEFADLADPCAPHDANGFDLILVNSVIQYMSQDELGGRLAQWRGLLAPRGRVVLSDLVPPDHRATWDVLAFLRFVAFRPSLWIERLTSQLLSYWRTGTGAPFLRVHPPDLVKRAGAAGLAVRYLPRGLTHFPRRQAAVLTAAGT
jgi:SAM-dependent methyltransferase